MAAAVNEKRKGTSGAEGVDFQMNLLLTTWLRANKIYGDNYDDVVLKYKNNDVSHFRLLQAKHVVDEEKTITYGDLISNDKFKIEKYFKSFADPKYFNVEKIEDLVLFTNLALDADVLPFVDALPADDPVFQFRQFKANGGTPNMHKLNSKFIKEYKYSKLRCIVKTFINCCVKGLQVEPKDHLFIECQFIISTDIANVKEKKFYSNFINCMSLSEGPEQFRRILFDELASSDRSRSSREVLQEWMRNVSLVFPSGFGESPRNKKTKVWPIVTLTPEEEKQFITFCGLFKLATNQPNEKELISFIQSECENVGRKPHVRLATLHLKYEISDWYKNRESPYPLNSTSLETIMGRIEKDKMGLELIVETKRKIDELSSLKLEFKYIPYEEDLKSFLQQSEKNSIHVNTKGCMHVSILKLFKCLETLQQIDHLFCPKAEISKMEQLFKVFKGSELFKILVCEVQSDEIGLEFMKEGGRLIKDNKQKKLIFVTNFYNRKEEMNNYHSFREIEDLTRFEDLAEETRKDLSERKVSFQGEDVAFYSIYGKEIPPNHQDIESWGILLDTQFKMNKIFVQFDSSYYINRTLTVNFPSFNKDTIQKELGYQHIVTFNNDDYIEQIKQHPTKHVHLLIKLKESWCRFVSNGGSKELLRYKTGAEHFEHPDDTLSQGIGIFIISDIAGYGKTTTTSYLANELQKQHPNCWVTRLQPSHLSFDPDEIKLTPEADICKYDNFLMENLFKITSPLERLVFKQYLEDEESKSQLFFIFDGFDEIDGEYQKVILKALKYLRTKPNVKSIRIATRPEYQEKLEEELQSVTLRLLPFDHQNKLTFLEKFWLSRGMKGQIERLRDYSERLIRLISQSIRDKESELTGIPLQMRMIGEIYDESAIKYLAGNLKENEIVAVDLFGLYEQFIKKKEDVYFNDKLCSILGTSQRSILLKPFRKIQTEFALKVILGGDYGDLQDQLKDSIGFGIIQENQGGFSFIHRTFAEFLTAKFILDYTLSLSTTFYIDQLMQVLHKENCGVVRKFINSKLDYRKMATALTKPEYKEAIQKIQHKQFQEAMITSAEEETFEVFRFQLEFYSYWYPEEMKEFLFRENENGYGRGLLYSLGKLKNITVTLYIDYMTQVWWTSDHNASVLSLEMFNGLITNIFRYRPFGYKVTAKMVTDLQDELEEKQILSKARLKSILFEISFEEFWDIRCGKEIIDYLKHLKMKHEQLFHLYLREKNKFVQSMVSEYGNDEFYELIGETCDPFWVFSTLVVSVFTDSDWSWENQIDLKSYLNFISKYIRHFDPQTLEEFKTYLLKYIQVYGWYSSDWVQSSGRSLLEFLRNHRKIISLEEFMQNIKIHKNLSFIENCALWRWKEDLEFILDAGDIEVEVVARLQLEGSESLDEKIKCILKSIRDNNTNEQLMEIARVNHEYQIEEVGTLDVTIISKAILQEDELRNEIYSSWMKSDELFDAFMTGTPVTYDSIKFVMKRFPQHIMRYFEINKNCFVGAPQHEELNFPSILENDNILNKEEFLSLNQLQNDDGETILFNICNRWNREEILYYEAEWHPLLVWLRLMKRKCSLDDIVRIFRTKNPNGETVFQILNNKSIYSGEEQIKCKSVLFTFFENLKLVELKEEIDIREEEVQEIWWSDDDNFWEEIQSSVEEESVGDKEISKDEKADGEGFTVNGGETILQGEKRSSDLDMDEGHSALKKPKQQLLLVYAPDLFILEKKEVRTKQ